MNFEQELSKGNFFIPECTKCLKVVWPPSEFCNYCFGDVSLKRKMSDGKIIEFSRKDNRYFCLVEFEKDIRIMAKISNSPSVNQLVKIEKCGVSNGNYFFQVI